MSHPQDLKVLLGHPHVDVRGTLESAIVEMGYTVIHVSNTADDLLDHARSRRPDVIISGAEYPDRDGIDALVELGKEIAIPAVIVTPQRSLSMVERALNDHVWAYLLEPIKKEEIQPTVYLVMRRFEMFEELKEEVEDLQDALKDRKIIERAKGLLMARGELTEDEAYKRLRRMATDKRKRIVDIASQVLEVEELSQEDNGD